MDNQAEVDGCPDGNKKQAQQYSFERFNVALQLVTEFAVGQNDSGQKRPQRRAQAHQHHYVGSAEHDQERRSREQFPQMNAGDKPQEGNNHKASAEDNQPHRGKQSYRLRPAGKTGQKRCLFSGGRSGGRQSQKRQQRQNGNDGDVLKQQYSKRAFPRFGSGQPFFPECLHDNCGGGHGQSQTARQRRLPVKSDGEKYRKNKDGRGAQLYGTGSQYEITHSPEIGRFQFEPDEEQHQHYAEFGKVHDVLSFCSDKAQGKRANDDSGKKIAQHRSHAQLFGNGNKKDRGRQID